MQTKKIANDNDVGNLKDKKKNEKLNEREIEELMSHSAYKRHKGAIKQVK